MSGHRRVMGMAVVVALAVLPLVVMRSTAEAQVASFDPYPSDIVDSRAPTNGCGSQGADGIDVPDEWRGVSFTPSCDWHDQCYGTKGLSQSYCDRGMFDKTTTACGGDSVCKAIAAVYWAGVAIGGGEPYREGQQDACDREPHRNGRGHGDPHLATFDGLNYDLMTAGEFTLVRDADGTDAVQARFHPTSDSFTVISGIAVRLGDSVISAQLDPETSELVVYVDGEPVVGSIAAVEDGFVELGERMEGVNQIVTIRRDDKLRVEGVVFGNRIDIGVNVFGVHFGQVTGLLGDADADPTDDLVNADTGEVIDTSDLLEPGWIEAFYESGFGESWRVEPADSMFVPDGDFDYHGEEARSWPRQIVTLESLFGPGFEEARQGCIVAGLTGDEATACAFDVVVSGDGSYAETAARSADRATAVASPELAVVVTDSSIGRGSSDDELEPVPSSPFIEALFANDLDEVRRLIDRGEPLDVISEAERMSPLSVAVLLRNVEAAELLLDAGASPNAITAGAFVHPLAQAASTGSVELVELLLERGADPDGVVENDDEFLPPAALAAGSPEVLRMLLDAGADPNGPPNATPPLIIAATSGEIEAAELLLDAGADVEIDGDLGPDRLTPLAGAVLGQRVEMVRFLLDRGANPNVQIGGRPLRDLVFSEEIRELLGG